MSESKAPTRNGGFCSCLQGSRLSYKGGVIPEKRPSKVAALFPRDATQSADDSGCHTWEELSLSSSVRKLIIRAQGLWHLWAHSSEVSVRA